MDTALILYRMQSMCDTSFRDNDWPINGVVHCSQPSRPNRNAIGYSGEPNSFQQLYIRQKSQAEVALTFDAVISI